MLKLNRPALEPALASDLGQRQSAVDQGQDPDDAWDRFKEDEGARSTTTVIGTLKEQSYGKCAYCETQGANELDHHWPKGPHKSLNQNRGTPAKMFSWKNLVLACHGCNSWECKGSHMKWTADERTMLLNPYEEGDDPLCHFDVEIEGTTSKNGTVLKIGWVEPREGLSGMALERALYTRKRLKLNIRDQLREGRSSALQRFLDYVGFFRELGPDHEIRKGRTIRRAFIEMLDPKEPYLAGIRQILRRDATLRAELFGKMPELGPILDQWDLAPDDCSKLNG